ncbi:MAG: response regulator [bacterium]
MTTSKKATIVYAEDSKSISTIVKAKLSSEGYEVHHFENGEGVVDAVVKYKPTAVVLDNDMPVKDGFTILQEIKKIPEVENIPIIFLTNKKDSQSVMNCLQFGVSDYIVKDPLAISTIISRIKRYIQ